MYKFLRNASIARKQEGKPPLEFYKDGSVKAVELKIVNLQPDNDERMVWEEIGVWQSWGEEKGDEHNVDHGDGLHPDKVGQM